MEQRDEPLLYLYEERDLGTGGKFKKTRSRKPPVTPYARSPAVKQTVHRQESGGGWFSKIVDPAYRLISSGSSRILPSFFSRSPSPNATPFDPVADELNEDFSDDDEEEKENLNMAVGSTGVALSSGAGDGKRCEVNFDEKIRNDEGTSSDASELSEIEKLLRGKNLSRDEIARLTEILHSKATGLCNAEQTNKPYSMTDQLTSVEVLAAHETPIKSIQKKVEGSNKDIWAASTPHPMSTHTQGVAGASPVDLARAYMGSRTSDIGTSSRNFIAKYERDHGDGFVTKPAIPLPSPKPICWPGAVVQEHYMTPQYEKGKLGLHRFPRTPYSRTIFSKSKSKMTQFQGESTKDPNTLLTPFQQFKSPHSEKVTSQTYSSVGPMRRIRNKFNENPDGSVASHSGLYNPSNVEKPRAYDSFSPASKNLESWVTGSTAKLRSVEMKPHMHEVGQTSVPSQSSRIARQILDHIDRKKPTLSEKSAELKVAIESKSSPPYESTKAVLKGNDNLPTVETLYSSNKMNTAGHTSFSAQGNDYATNSLLKPQHEGRSGHVANNGVTQKDSSSSLKFRSSEPSEGRAGLSFDFSKNRKSQIKNVNEVFMGSNNSEQKEKNELQPHNHINGKHHLVKVPNSSGSDVLNLQKLHPRASSNKPVLSFISTNKPSLGTTQNFGFTFPVSSASSVFSEPPTPSVMPTSFLASIRQSKAKESESIPTYTFDSKRSTTPIVFSFPSTSVVNANTDDGSSIKFTFGSDKSSRVSFSCC